MSSGIYKITIGKWFYYGQTNNFDRRKREHLSALQKQKHDNIILQNAYNKHNLFHFEECAYENNENLLTELEQLVIDEWFGKPYCANINPNADKPPSTKGKKLKRTNSGIKQTEEWIEKRMIAHRGSKRTEEARAKMSAAAKLRCERKRKEKENGLI